MEFFSKPRFERDLQDYYKHPSLDKMECIVATYLVPLCRRYAAAGYINFVYSDREEAAQIAAIKCWEKIPQFRRITSPRGKDGSPLAYFDQIAFHAMLAHETKEKIIALRTVSIDA